MYFTELLQLIQDGWSEHFISQHIYWVKLWTLASALQKRDFNKAVSNHDASFTRRFSCWYAVDSSLTLFSSAFTSLFFTLTHSIDTTVAVMLWCVDHWLPWSTVSACLQIWKKNPLRCLKLLRNTSYREWQSRHTLWGDCLIVITDCNVSHVASSSYGALCGSRCYFEGSAVTLTTGCQCDFVPSLGTLWLQSCRWWKVQITLITVNLFRYLLSVEIAFTCQLQCSPAQFNLQIFLDILPWLKWISPDTVVT